MSGEKDLTCTNKYDTVYPLLRIAKAMDATVKRMVNQLRQLRAEIAGLQRQADSLKTSLGMLGVRPGKDPFSMEGWDERYAQGLPFKQLSLVETCRRILMDNQGEFLDKSQVEYLAVMGGYEFSAKDQKNSVSVTLQRLAADSFCEAERTRGPSGNKYRWVMRFPREKPEKDTGT